MNKILLVEDDMFLRQLYFDLLVAEKFEVDYAEDGKIGYEKMKKSGWDLVLLDLNLPEMNGLDILKKLEEEKVSNFTKKLVFLTNSDNPKDIAEIEKVSDGYLMKSQLNPDEFVTKVRTYLQ